METMCLDRVYATKTLLLPPGHPAMPEADQIVPCPSMSWVLISHSGGIHFDSQLPDTHSPLELCTKFQTHIPLWSYALSSSFSVPRTLLSWLE